MLVPAEEGFAVVSSEEEGEAVQVGAPSHRKTPGAVKLTNSDFSTTEMQLTALRASGPGPLIIVR